MKPAETKTDIMHLPCPDCLARGVEPRSANIGNNRRDCRNCNRFASAVTRDTTKRLREANPDSYDALYEDARVALYERYGDPAEAKRAKRRHAVRKGG